MDHSQLYDVFFSILRGQPVDDAELYEVLARYEPLLRLNLWLSVGFCVALLVAFSLLYAADREWARFRGPGGELEVVGTRSAAWHLALGPFWLLGKGDWPQGLLALALCLLTFGLSWLAYPLFTLALRRRRLLRKGWKEENRGAPPSTPPGG